MYPFLNQADPRLFAGQPLAGTYAYTSPVYSTPNYDVAQLYSRIDELRAQINGIYEILHADLAIRGGLPRVNPVFARNLQTSHQPLRLRESSSNLFLELYLEGLTMGDVDVEVHGHSIVCRTRVPVSPNSRWWNANMIQLPRGLEIFELSDGRIEFCWLAPVTFNAKDIEAVWRDGFLCICVAKTEVGTRQTVKVVKETSSHRRASGDTMNS